MWNVKEIILVNLSKFIIITLLILLQYIINSTCLYEEYEIAYTNFKTYINLIAFIYS